MASLAIILACVLALWLLADLGGAGSFAQAWPAAAGAAIACLAAASRLGLGPPGGAARAPFIALFWAVRTPARLLAAFKVALSGYGLRRTAPVLVRLKLRPAATGASASVVAAMNGLAGSLVVDADAGSLLSHVLVEQDVDVAAMQATERRALSAAGGGS